MRAIEKMHEVTRQKRELGLIANPEHNLIKRVNSHPSSKAKAIAAFCFHCMGGTEDELQDAGWKDMIRTCTSPNCPLYQHRPYRKNLQIAVMFGFYG